MDINGSTTALREPVASRDTALACLAQLGVQNGLDPAVAAARRGDVADSEALSIARLIEVAGDFELRADHARVDWEGLQTIGFADPVLVLLKNTNVVILTGGGRDGAEEVTVWDPLHRNSEVLFVPRKEFERAWSGDALRVAPVPSRASGLTANTPEFSSEPASDPGNLRSSQTGKQASLVTRFCAVAVAITATAGAGTGLYLFTRSAPENFTSATASAGGASARIIEPTDSKPGEASGPSPDQQIVGITASSASATANVPPSDTAAIVASIPEGISSGPAQRFVAPPPQAASNREERSLEPPSVASMSVARTASEVAAPETNTSVATAASVIPSADAALSAAEIAVLLTRGDTSLSAGDVASARLYYGRAANAGNGQAALRLGETFDPVFLDHAHLRSVRGDVAVALSWYQRARALGAAEAEVLLNSLEAK